MALGRDMADVPYGVRTVGPASHGILIMNPWSGGGKVDKFGLEAEARRRGVAPILLQRGDDLRALAEQAVARGADVIGMAGGDGSQVLAATWHAGTTSRSCAFPPVPATISLSTSGSTAPRWWPRSTHTAPPSSDAWTWP